MIENLIVSCIKNLIITLVDLKLELFPNKIFSKLNFMLIKLMKLIKKHILLYLMKDNLFL